MTARRARPACTSTCTGTNYLRTTDSAEVGSKLQAAGNVTIAAANDINARAVDLQAGKNLNVNIAAATGANAAANNFLFSINKKELNRSAAACSPKNAVACNRKTTLETRDTTLDALQVTYSKETSKAGIKDMIGQVSDVYQSDFSKYGIDAESFLLTMANIESSMNPTSTNSSGFQGLYQFSSILANSTYNIGNPDASIRLDPVWSTAAAAQLALCSANALSKQGIAVTPENLYLAHQQGVGGASFLLKNSEMNVVDALMLTGAYKTPEKAAKSISGNGGNVTRTAAEFVAIWSTKYQTKLKEAK
jgi:hypothetical protein